MLQIVRMPRVNALRKAARRATVLIGCGLIPVVLLAVFLSPGFSSGAGTAQDAFGFDFRASWGAAGDVLERESPYPAPTHAALDGEDQFVYPPPAAIAAIPFRLLPFDAAALAFAVLLVGATILTLRVLEVSDWRCYGLVFAWLPVLDGVRLGAVSILLALGVAIVWRWRARAPVVIAATAALVAAKLFLWPLALWLAVTGRLRQAAASIAVAAAVTLGAWAVIDFAGLRDYPAMLSALTDVVAWNSYSLDALAVAAGLPELAQRLLPLAVGGAALALVILFGRRRTRDDDARAFCTAIAAALALSPIVWTHYFALLVVPIALARPRLSPLWLLPLAFWLSPNQSGGELWRIGLVLAVTCVVFVVTIGASLPRPARLHQARPRDANRDDTTADFDRRLSVNHQP